MAVPRRPHQPRASRTTRPRRTTTHAATRAPQCTSHCSQRPLHKRLHLLQAPYRTGARRDRQDASPRGARGGTPRAQATELALRYPSRAAVQSACRLHSSPACSEHSARVLRAAPLPPRAWSALHEARAWHAARTLRHPFSPLSSLPAHSTEHMHMCMCMTCARRAVRTAMQPVPRDSRLPHVEPAPAARSTVSILFLQKENQKRKPQRESKRLRALLPATRYRSSGPLGALPSSPALDVRLMTALQVLQVPPGSWE